MSSIKEILPIRLKNARVSRGLSMAALGEKVQVSAQMISKYEKGLSFPTSEVLSALLQALNIKIDMLLKPLVQQEQVKFTFRKQSGLSNPDIERIKQQVLDKAEKFVELGDILCINRTCELLDKYKNNKIDSPILAKSIAQQVRKDMRLGEEPIANLHEFIENCNIRIIIINEPKKIDGLNFLINGYPFIVLNIYDKPTERIRFSLAHELAHLLLNIPDDVEEKQEERICDAFASELLFPSSRVTALLGNGRRHNIAVAELKRIQCVYGISIDAIMYKAKELDIISEDRYTGYHKKKNFDSSFKEIVENSEYNEEYSEQYSSLVYQALSMDLISISKTSYFLNMSVEKINAELKFA